MVDVEERSREVDASNVAAHVRVESVGNRRAPCQMSIHASASIRQSLCLLVATNVIE